MNRRLDFSRLNILRFSMFSESFVFRFLSRYISAFEPPPPSTYSSNELHDALQRLISAFANARCDAAAKKTNSSRITDDDGDETNVRFKAGSPTIGDTRFGARE